MKTLKISVILLALLLAAMVPMVSAGEDVIQKDLSGTTYTDISKSDI